MMTTTRTKLNYSGVKKVLNSSEVRRYLTTLAEGVLSAAVSGAPSDTGAYRSGLHIEQDTSDRAVVRVGSDVDYAWAVEANTGNLSRALDAAR